MWIEAIDLHMHILFHKKKLKTIIPDGLPQV